MGEPKSPKLKKQYMPFHEARAKVRALKLKNFRGWSAARAAGLIPKEIASSPGNAYANEGWNGWGDWLGNGNRRRVGRTAAVQHFDVRTHAEPQTTPSKASRSD